MSSINPIVRTARAPTMWILSSALACQALAIDATANAHELQSDATTAADLIFRSGFELAGYAIPLASPATDYLYTAQVAVGNQTFALTIDTGSTTLAVAGVTCSGCTNVSPLYSPSKSATSTGHTASSTYEDGSGWTGAVYLDTVGFGYGSPAVTQEIADITHAKSNFFTGTNDYQGIIGLGPAQNEEPSTDGYIPLAFAAGLDNVFAFDLCDNTGGDAGTMWLGGDGGVTSVQYTPLVPITDNNPFYAIDVDALSLGGTTIVSNAASTFEEPVIDTGTSLFYVPTSVFNSFRQALQQSAGFKAVFGTNTIATSGANKGCVTGESTVTDSEVESDLPIISLSLPNLTSGQPDVTIQASALDTYLYNSDGNGQYCLAIQDGGTQDASTFGDAFMQAFHIVIDVTGGRVGFAPPTTCVAPAISKIRRPTQVGPHRPPRWPRP